MHIERQKARAITNIENRNGYAPDPEVRELLALVRTVVGQGRLERQQAAEIEDAAEEVGRAADEVGTRSSRFRRAIASLKHASEGATAAAGIAEAVESVVRTVASP
jgi:hypothetical protein